MDYLKSNPWLLNFAVKAIIQQKNSLNKRNLIIIVEI